MAFWAVRLASNHDEKPGLVATQTVAFLCADIEGPAAMAGWVGDACAGVAPSRRRLLRAGLAAHGG